MKIIDILVKIANNEEVPKKIKYQDKIWEYKEYNSDYKNEDINLFEDLFKKFNTKYFINAEVEIIEEPKKIEKIKISTDKCGRRYIAGVKNKIFSYANADLIFADKINELIDEIYKMKEGK